MGGSAQGRISQVEVSIREVSIREGSAQGRVSPGGSAHGRIIPWEDKLMGVSTLERINL